jgi:hypothetical protein
MEIIYTIALYLFFLCLLGFIIGLCLLAENKTKEKGLKIILFSIIGMIIGYGTCTINF